MPQFNEIFQSDVKFRCLETMSINDIENALSHSYLAQNPTNPANLSKLEKSIIKEAEMWQHPKLVYVDEMQSWVLAGGRHRIETAKRISQAYGLNASGKLVEIDADDDANLELDPIYPVVDVLKYQVKDRKALVRFLQSDNESRSMTVEEKNAGKEYAQTMTPLESLKSRLGKRIHALIGNSPLMFDDTENETLKSVTVTKETCRLIAVKLAALGKTKFKYATNDDIETLAKAFAEFLKENSEQFSSAFARDGYKDAVENFSALEYDGVLLDSEGEQIEDPTFMQYWAAQVKTPAKKGKSKAAELSEKLAALADMLAKQGIDASAILNG